MVSGSVWRVSLECLVGALVKSTLRQAIPTTMRLLYKSTVFSTSALFLHFSRVAEWCLEGVWRVSGGCLKGVWECVVSDYDCLAKVLVINMLDQAQKLGLKAPASSCSSKTHTGIARPVPFLPVSSKGPKRDKNSKSNVAVASFFFNENMVVF